MISQALESAAAPRDFSRIPPERGGGFAHGSEQRKLSNACRARADRSALRGSNAPNSGPRRSPRSVRAGARGAGVGVVLLGASLRAVDPRTELSGAPWSESYRIE